METILGLPLHEAFKKSKEIVEHDEKLFGNNMGLQLQMLLTRYQKFDPDKAFAFLCSKEPNLDVLGKHAVFLLKMCAMPLGNCLHQCIEADFLIQKYGLHSPQTKFRENGSQEHTFGLLLWIFVEKIFEEIRQKSLWVIDIIEIGKTRYQNFKKEYGIISIMAMLPVGQKYGGFVKAYLHLHAMRIRAQNAEFASFSDNYMLHWTLAPSRILFNSKIYSNEDRLKFFDKLSIKANDCRKWTKKFDEKFPELQNVYKIFGQIA